MIHRYIDRYIDLYRWIDRERFCKFSAVPLPLACARSKSPGQTRKLSTKGTMPCQMSRAASAHLWRRSRSLLDTARRRRHLQKGGDELKTANRGRQIKGSTS